MKKIIILFISLFVMLYVFGQDVQKKKGHLIVNPTKLVDKKQKFESKLENALKNYDFNAVLSLSDSILNYSKLTNDSLFMAYAYEIKAEIYKYQPNNLKAKNNLVKAISIFKAKKQYSKLVSLKSSLASIYRLDGKLDSSRQILQDAAFYISDSTSNLSLKYYYNQKSSNFEYVSRLDSSIYYIFKRIEITNPNDYYALSTANIKLAGLFYKLSDYEKALIFTNRALQLVNSDKKQFKLTKVKACILKSRVLFQLNKIEEARAFVNKALGLINENTNDNYKIQLQILISKIKFKTSKNSSNLKIISETLLKNKNISTANLFSFYLTQLQQAQVLNYKNKSTLVIKKITRLLPKIGSLNLKKEFYKLAVTYYQSINQFQKAFAYQSLYIKEKNLTNDRNKMYIVYDLENKYKIQKKDKEIAEQQLQLEKKSMQNKLITGIAIFLLISSILSWLVFKQRQKRKNQELLVLKNEAQINALESLIEGEEKERLRIAKELHDGVNGDLSAIKHKLNTLLKLNNKTIEEAVVMIDKSCEQVRAISHNLVPPALTNFDLQEAASDYCTNMNNIHSPKITFSYLGDNVVLPKIIEINIFRIIQELITNSIKHAEAKKIDVQLSVRDNTMQLAVEDDGKGFDLSKTNSDGVGISNIRHRVRFLNGEIDFTSNNEGTFVNILMDKSRFNDS